MHCAIAHQAKAWLGLPVIFFPFFFWHVPVKEEERTHKGLRSETHQLCPGSQGLLRANHAWEKLACASACPWSGLSGMWCTVILLSIPLLCWHEPLSDLKLNGFLILLNSLLWLRCLLCTLVRLHQSQGVPMRFTGYGSKEDSQGWMISLEFSFLLCRRNNVNYNQVRDKYISHRVLGKAW